MPPADLGALLAALDLWPADVERPALAARSAADEAADWFAAGGGELSGGAGGPGLAPPGPVMGRARHAVALLAALTPAGGAAATDVAELLFGRAARLGLRRQGRTSAGGATRLLRAVDGWVAVALPRADDVESVPAIVERVDVADPWLALAEAAAAGPASDLAARAHLLGVPAAVLGESVGLEPLRSVVGFRPMATKTNGRTKAETMVVDLSAMWAGPLCARLLGLGGSRVVKVESEDRPDGARRGDPGFYEWLHGGHESVVLDFGSVGGRAELQELLAAADVVLESSRPRALRSLGITADDLVARGATWVSITGYGRTEAGAGRVAFGDDAAVAGGLVAWDDAGEPLFAGDAIADPLTGLYAAVAASAAMCTGGGRLLDVAMAGVAAHVAAPVG